MDAAEVTGDPSLVKTALATLGSSLDGLIEALDQDGLTQLADADLVELMRDFERTRNRMSVVDHHCISDAEARSLPISLCRGSMRQLLTSALRLSKGEAGRRVRAAAALGRRSSALGQPLEPRRPALAAAQRTGEVSSEQVGIVERAIGSVDQRGFDPDDVAAGEELLTQHAATFAPEPLRQLAEQVVNAIDPDGTLPDDELNASRRHFHLRPTRDGAFVGEFRLTGAAGAKLAAVLEPLAKARPACDSVTPAAGGDDGTSSQPQRDVDLRSRGQRMHDALEEVCDRMLRSGDLPESGGVPASVIVTINLDDLLNRLGIAHTADGTRLSTKAVLDLAASADIIPVVLNRGGAVLDLGRSRRIATPSQSHALSARDRGCSFPGCDRAPQWCERHHILAWLEAAGPTWTT